MSDELYEIKKCPGYMDKKPHGICKLTFRYGGFETKTCKYCIGCTDCLLKQIVTLCKEANKVCKECNSPYPEIDCIDCTEGGRSDLAHTILTLLELEPFQTPEFLAKLKEEGE